MTVKTSIIIQTSLEVSDQHCADIMCTALEGGIGYWAQARKIKTLPGDTPGVRDYVSCELAELNNDESGYDWDHPMKLTYGVIVEGVRRVCTDQRFSHLAKGVFDDIANDNMGCYIDADVADCIVQIGLFNEIRYG